MHTFVGAHLFFTVQVLMLDLLYPGVWKRGATFSLNNNSKLIRSDVLLHAQPIVYLRAGSRNFVKGRFCPGQAGPQLHHSRLANYTLSFSSIQL